MFDNYVVLENDTFSGIANKFNTTEDILKKINGDNLITGMNLLIPKISSKYFDYYVVSSGDTLYKIANNNNIDPQLLAILNGINESDYIYPNQVLLIPKAGSVLYITAVGDTLTEIAKGLNISIEELLEQNNNIYLQPEQLIVYKYK